MPNNPYHGVHYLIWSMNDAFAIQVLKIIYSLRKSRCTSWILCTELYKNWKTCNCWISWLSRQLELYSNLISQLVTKIYMKSIRNIFIALVPTYWFLLLIIVPKFSWVEEGIHSISSSYETLLLWLVNAYNCLLKPYNVVEKLI